MPRFLLYISLLALTGCTDPTVPQSPANTGNTEAAPVKVADQILTNGKILVVDRDFSVAEAVAIQGDRILAAGSMEEISALTGPTTSVMDLQGRTVIPGLIDNHHHFVRATEQWYRHVRWDAVTTRQQALALLQERAATLPAGEWLVVLGGWIFEQFSDDSSPFTLAELDVVLPDNPLYIQLGYSRGYTNSLALRAAGVDDTTQISGPGSIVKDDTGRLTGELVGAGAFMTVAGSIPATPDEVWDRGLQLTVQDYIKAGITALLDVGGNTVTEHHYDAVKRAAVSGDLSLRVFYTLNTTNGVGPSADEIISALDSVPPRSGDDRFGQFAYGEMTYAGIRDPAGFDYWKPAPEVIDDYRRIAATAARRGWQIHEHSTRDDKIAALLSVFEEVDGQYPLRGRRWTMAHCENISDVSIDRAIKLGVLFAIHSSAGLGAPAQAARLGPDAISRVPPVRTINNKGGIWGLGSDGTVVAGYNPFYNIGWAVTGKARNGVRYLEETVSREAALIAHTRSNAYLLFMEDVLGSLEPGKYADLVVLDRDYMTVTEDEIFNIKPLMTMIGGKAVYKAEGI